MCVSASMLILLMKLSVRWFVDSLRTTRPSGSFIRRYYTQWTHFRVKTPLRMPHPIIHKGVWTRVYSPKGEGCIFFVGWRRVYRGPVLIVYTLVHFNIHHKILFKPQNTCLCNRDVYPCEEQNIRNMSSM